MKLVLAIIGSFITVLPNLISQATGEVVYDRTVYYSKILDGLPYLSEEERDRQKLTWGKDEGWSHPYVLQFDEEKSLYTYGEEERSYAYSWKKDEYLLLEDRANNRIKHQVVLGGKLYVINDDTPKKKWKILNEIREVEGYLCMKAETIDTIKNQVVHAWFTSEIPVASGPEGFGGLPGLILMLEINNGTAVIEASKVTFDSDEIEFKIPKKIKGKDITSEGYSEALDKYFKQCIDGERNPFWQSRY